MLGTDTGVVKSSTDRVSLNDLADWGLENVRPHTVQYTRLTLRKSGAVPFAVKTYSMA